SELLQLAAVTTDPPDVSRPLAVRGEYDPLSIGRERGIVVVLEMGREWLCVPSVGVGHEDVRVPGAEVRKSDDVARLGLSLGHASADTYQPHTDQKNDQITMDNPHQQHL